VTDDQRRSVPYDETKDGPEDPPPTYRRLSDIGLIPVQPLLFDMLEPDLHSILLADGGTGKGQTFTYIAAQATRADPEAVVMVYDAEGREQEWRRRASGLLVPEDRFIVVNAKDLGPRHAGKPIWDITDRLDRIRKDCGATLMGVDSLMSAINIDGDRMKSDPVAPWTYLRAMESFGITSASLAHPASGSRTAPYGSVNWRNAARLIPLGKPGPDGGPNTLTISWVISKGNERDKAGPEVRLRFHYVGPRGMTSLAGVERLDVSGPKPTKAPAVTTRQWLTRVMGDGRPHATIDLAILMAGKGATEEMVAKAQTLISNTLNGMRKAGLVFKPGSGSGTGTTWMLIEGNP
jgi:hypothetical protein